MKRVFAALSKVEENGDGTLTVEGIASTEAVDSDGEVVKASAIEAALPDFMRYGTGNLREMHQPLAAGTVEAVTVENDVTRIVAKVVDPTAIKKVQTGTYKGFSIGGKVTDRDQLNRKIVKGVKLVEISLVDRPANPEAVIEMWKAETMDNQGEENTVEEVTEPTTTEEVVTDPVVEPDASKAETVPTNKGDDFEQVWRSARDGSIHLRKADLVAHHKALDESAALEEITGSAIGKLNEIEEVVKREFSSEQRKDDAKSGAAMKDGSYPIENKADLENAIKAFGRSKNKAATKRHIVRRAKALGATDMLPKGWEGSTKKAARGDDLAKAVSLYRIANMVQLLSTLDELEEAFESESPWGDAVHVPVELSNRFGECLLEFGDICRESLDIILNAMADEESEEAFMRGELAAEMMKAAAVNPTKPEEVEKAEEADDLVKAETDPGLLKKAYDALEARINEVLPSLQETITKMAGENGELRKEIETLKAQPMPAKTAAAAVGKEEDAIGKAAEPVMTKAEVQAQIDALSPEDRALALIKIARGSPIALQPRG